MLYINYILEEFDYVYYEFWVLFGGVGDVCIFVRVNFLELSLVKGIFIFISL